MFIEPCYVHADNQMNKKLSQKLSALGIAKLPGFFEWLSIHPIMTEVDEEKTGEESCGFHKMIIFCYHHKVLDGVQVRIQLICIYIFLLYFSIIIFPGVYGLGNQHSKFIK